MTFKTLNTDESKSVIGREAVSLEGLSGTIKQGSVGPHLLFRNPVTDSPVYCSSFEGSSHGDDGAPWNTGCTQDNTALNGGEPKSQEEVMKSLIPDHNLSVYDESYNESTNEMEPAMLFSATPPGEDAAKKVCDA